jgi:hypothetical protein
VDVTIKELTSVVTASQMMKTTIGAKPGQHLASEFTTVTALTMQTPHQKTTSSTAPLQPLSPCTIFVTNNTDRQLWSIPVLRLEILCSTCLTGVVSALSESSMCPPRHQLPERVQAWKAGHRDVFYQDRMCLD